MKKLAGFDTTAARCLVLAMKRAFPFVEVEPGEEHWRMLADVALPDEDDHHVLTAALAAEATVLCTSNTRDFPADAVAALDVEVAGHAPDTTWNGQPIPFQWLDLSPRPNLSLAGQVNRYPLAQRPTRFVFKP